MSFITFILIVIICVVPAYARISNISVENKSGQLFLPPLLSNTLKTEAVVKKLDDLLAAQEIDEDWYAHINDALSELGFLDKNLSHAYLKKIFSKTAQHSPATTSESPSYKTELNPSKIPVNSSDSESEMSASEKSFKIDKREVIQSLDNLLAQKVVDDVWYTEVNNLVVDLAVLDRNLSNVYFKKVLDRITQDTISESKPKSVLKADVSTDSEKSFEMQLHEIDRAKNHIIHKLDNALQQEKIDDEWYAMVDDLIVDLARIDRSLSNEYLKKIRMNKPLEKIAIPTPPQKPSYEIPEVQKSDGSSGSAMQKGTPPPLPGSMQKGIPPLPPGGAMVKGTPPLPPVVSAGIKKGTPPPPPGPMVKGKKPVVAIKGPLVPAIPKGPEPLSIKESYGARQLQKRSNEEIIELFNKLLDSLGSNPDFWNALQKKPTLEWENKINAVKKALSDPVRNIDIDATKRIADQISHVKAQKAQEGLAKQAAAEQKEEVKHQEELSEEELLRKITALNKRPDVTDFKWLIEFQGNVKKLDKLNHEKAAAYEAEFIKKFPGQKQFLPKPKLQEPIEAKKN